MQPTLNKEAAIFWIISLSFLWPISFVFIIRLPVILGKAIDRTRNWFWGEVEKVYFLPEGPKAKIINGITIDGWLIIWITVAVNAGWIH